MPEVDWVRSARRKAPLLSLLLALFLGRVLAQLAVAAGVEGWLPPFEAFMSGLLPYGLLLPAQLLIVIVYARTCMDFWVGGEWARPRRRWGVALAWFGFIYLALMLFRFWVWATRHPGTLWMGGPIPTVFHWVLAGFILVVARQLLEEVEPVGAAREG